MSGDVCGVTRVELEERFKSCGEPAYRAAQVFDWIYKKLAFSWEEMTSLPKSLREKLAVEIPFPVLIEKDVCVSEDGTRKFLFALVDGQLIETVYIPTEKRATLCISSQAGCKYACRFCASGLGGFKRQLSVGEIIGQVLWAMKKCQDMGQVTHIVFMGVGEPLDNYDQVIKAVGLLNAPEGFQIAARRITISTCGLVEGIRRLSDEGLQIELSVSLHASEDGLRSQLMPVNRKYPLRELIAATRAYADKTDRQVTFEYILIKDLTCTQQAVRELEMLLKGWLCKINLIAYNPVGEFSYHPPSKEEIIRFKSALESKGIITTWRTPRGKDIAAACGQLRHGLKMLKEI
ncbi:MAG: 23S rRNA (adenine(2503)-C(2))-methyltransferase RlmN [Candidatus Omnitrophota bacterium]